MAPPKPYLLTVDDDPEVLRAVERDLRRRYGRDYRVMRADSGAAALDALAQLQRRGEPVALLLADQRMPEMNGIEFLNRAMRHYPDARRVLLTAYADTEVAIDGINTVRLDYYLQKPWDPPEERLFPKLDVLLEAWRAEWRPEYQGIRVIGNRWSPETHAVKDFLSRNRIDFRTLDVETQAHEARGWLDRAGADAGRLPVVVLPDGTHLARPDVVELAEKVGLRTRAERDHYDLLIVGGGPAGLAAAVYAASEGLKTVMVEREAPGGQAGTSSMIKNYLGFDEGITGRDLADRAVKQAEYFGVEVLTPREVTGVRVEDRYRVVVCSDGAEIAADALMVATGVSYRTLDAPGVDRLTGRGVYYGAAMTEALSCRDEHVYIVGGANSAGQAAMFFAGYASHVTMLVRGPSLAATMSQYLIDEIARTPNINVWTGAQVAEARGEANLEALVIRDDAAGETRIVPATALFIFIGAAPQTDWLPRGVERDLRGFVCTGPDLLNDGRSPRTWPLERQPFLLETSVPGIFAVGDVRRGSVKRVASGVGEGSVAVSFVHQYLATL